MCFSLRPPGEQGVEIPGFLLSFCFDLSPEDRMATCRLSLHQVLAEIADLLTLRNHSGAMVIPRCGYHGLDTAVGKESNADTHKNRPST